MSESRRIEVRLDAHPADGGPAEAFTVASIADAARATDGEIEAAVQALRGLLVQARHGVLDAGDRGESAVGAGAAPTLEMLPKRADLARVRADGAARHETKAKADAEAREKAREAFRAKLIVDLKAALESQGWARIPLGNEPPMDLVNAVFEHLKQDGYTVKYDRDLYNGDQRYLVVN